MLRHTLRELLRNLNPKEASQNSFKHFHAKGLNYLCLSRTPTFTAKCYVLRPGEFELNPDGLLVNPHSHVYNFSTYVASGRIANYVYEPFQGTGGFGWHNFEFASQLKWPGKSSKCVGECGLRTHYIETLGKDEHYWLCHDAVHSIWVDPTAYTVLLLFQYADVVKEHTSLYMREARLPSLDGLYERYSAEEIEQLRREVLLHV